MNLEIFKQIRTIGGYSYFCGGCARDKILGIPSRDIDIEVYGFTYESLTSFLSQYGSVDTVGKSFSIVKFRNETFEADFALPRKESKTGSKHTSFAVYSDLFMSKAEACSRRDFTINSILIDVLSDEIFDYYGGIQDLKDGVLRATSEKTFGDDVLRVLRGFQFASRFNMKVEPKTAKLCRELRSEYSSLSLDRVWGEWLKFFTLSDRPSAGLQFLIDTGWSELYPEFHSNIGVQQNPAWHPEGPVEIHTMHVCDEAMEIARKENLSEKDTSILLCSALCHDFAKSTHSQGEFPNITSYGHEAAGKPLAESFLKRIGSPSYMMEHVPVLVENHMAYLNCQSEKAVRKLSVKLEPSNIYMLSLLINADHSGRPPLPKGLPEKAQRMLELSQQENVSIQRQKRILEGRHLKELGLPASPLYGKIISEVYQKQLDGQIKNLEEALKWVKEFINKGNL